MLGVWVLELPWRFGLGAFLCPVLPKYNHFSIDIAIKSKLFVSRVKTLKNPNQNAVFDLFFGFVSPFLPYTQFFGNEGRKTPKSKLQAPEKIQHPTPRRRGSAWPWGGKDFETVRA
jgi:hypothetical protein